MVPRPVKGVNSGEMSCNALNRRVALANVPQLHLPIVGGGEQLARNLVPLVIEEDDLFPMMLETRDFAAIGTVLEAAISS